MLLDYSLLICMLLKLSLSLREMSHPWWDYGRFVSVPFFPVFFK